MDKKATRNRRRHILLKVGVLLGVMIVAMVAFFVTSFAGSRSDARESVPAQYQIVVEEEIIEDETVPLAAPGSAAAMPEVTFFDRADGITVTVDAPEGAFPEGTAMRVVKADADETEEAVSEVLEGNVGRIRAIEAVFLDPEGEEIVPAQAVRVTMTCSGSTEADTTIVCLDAEGSAKVEEYADWHEGRVTFEVADLSVCAFVLAEEGEE